MNIRTKILNEAVACRTIIGEKDILKINFENGTTKCLKLPDSIIVIGQGAYDLNNIGSDYAYLIDCYWDFTNDPHCPVLFKCEKWGFVNKWFEIVSPDLYDSVGIIHSGHGCHTPPLQTNSHGKMTNVL